MNCILKFSKQFLKSMNKAAVTKTKNNMALRLTINVKPG